MRKSMYFMTLLVIGELSVSVEGFLKWNFSEDSAYYPINTPFPPALVRGNVPGDERIVTVHRNDDVWEAAGLSIVTGKPVWTASFPGVNKEDIRGGIAIGDPFYHHQNSFNLALVQLRDTLIALDGLTGNLVWQWKIPINTTIDKLSGWNDALGVMLHGAPEFSPYIPIPTIPTRILILSASDGSLRWSKNGTELIPLTQKDAAAFYIESLVVGGDHVVFSRANKLAVVALESGDLLWSTRVSVQGGAIQGQGANITHVRYIPPEPTQWGSDIIKPPRLLLNANNWSFQRFILLEFNTTNITAPGEVTWRSKTAETALQALDLTQPVVDSSPGIDMFFYWSNRTDWTLGETPTFEIRLVGRSLVDGTESWSSVYSPPENRYALPAVSLGKVFAVTTNGLKVMQATSGAVIWEQGLKGPEASIPVNDPARDQSLNEWSESYLLSPSFGNESGQLVASRCLEDGAEGMCMYGGYGTAPASGSYATATSWLIVFTLWFTTKLF